MNTSSTSFGRVWRSISSRETPDPASAARSSASLAIRTSRPVRSRTPSTNLRRRNGGVKSSAVPPMVTPGPPVQCATTSETIPSVSAIMSL